MDKNWTRRDFIRVGTASAATGAAAAKFTLLQPKNVWASPRPIAPSDTIRFASIGTGVRGSIVECNYPRSGNRVRCGV